MDREYNFQFLKEMAGVKTPELTSMVANFDIYLKEGIISNKTHFSNKPRYMVLSYFIDVINQNFEEYEIFSALYNE